MLGRDRASKCDMAASEALGIHHVTAIAGDPQTNIDFYTNVLGLRLVKLTVKPRGYGDGGGHPGTILIFFPLPDASKGRRGTGQVTDTAFALPETGIDFWASRLTERCTGFDDRLDRLVNLSSRGVPRCTVLVASHRKSILSFGRLGTVGDARRSQFRLHGT